ncbi:MAG: amidohydrolase [Deltaproteobacteria bacterium]|nr:amidohydrolase [Deltaproteobacteria bacterium]MDQ3296086.1 amidohydrolase [Myxococcota bacterium]
MDPTRPHATAIAIANDQILAVGSDAEMRALAGPGATVIALAGKTVTPGLIDAHCHLYGLGAYLDNVALRGLGSAEETVRVVAEAAKTRPASEWLLGRGWDQNRWAGQQFPTKAILDAAISDRPVLLRRVDGHASWLNSKALEAANITRDTKDPAGGKIVRDANGEPTGILIDNARELVDAVMPVASAEVRERRIMAAAANAIAAGITGVHEMGIDDTTAEVYRKLAAANRLPLRVYAFLSGDAANLARVRQPPAPAIGRFVMRAVKYYADGALGSRGARLYQPYDDEETNRGLWVTEPDKLAIAVETAVGAGWQVGVHAIGDAAVGAVLDAYLRAQLKHPGEHRLRVEHTQVIAMDDVPRMVEAKAIASMQPTHATSDMPWAEQRVGGGRIKGAYAWRTMLDKGIPLAAGSDFPVEEVSPLLGIYAAVTRQDAKGQPPGGWMPRQKLTLDEAIAAFTTGAAYAEHAEATRGMIAPGRTADVTVFDRALAPDRSLLEARAAATIVGGAIVHEIPGVLPRSAGGS